MSDRGAASRAGADQTQDIDGPRGGPASRHPVVMNQGAVRVSLRFPTPIESDPRHSHKSIKDELISVTVIIITSAVVRDRRI